MKMLAKQRSANIEFNVGEQHVTRLFFKDGCIEIGLLSLIMIGHMNFGGG